MKIDKSGNYKNSPLTVNTPGYPGRQLELTGTTEFVLSGAISTSLGELLSSVQESAYTAKTDDIASAGLISGSLAFFDFLW